MCACPLLLTLLLLELAVLQLANTESGAFVGFCCRPAAVAASGTAQLQLLLHAARSGTGGTLGGSIQRPVLANLVLAPLVLLLLRGAPVLPMLLDGRAPVLDQLDLPELVRWGNGTRGFCAERDA